MTCPARPSRCPPTTRDLELRLEARPEAVARARREVAGLARRAGLDETRRADVAVAVSEACANAIVHAYAGGEPGCLTITATIVPRGLEVVVADAGRGLAPRTDSPGIGLGLPLMVALTTEVDIRTAPGGGTEIWMLFAEPSQGAQVRWAEAG